MSFRGAGPIGSIGDVGISGFAAGLGELPEIATVQTAPIGAEPRNDDLISFDTELRFLQLLV